MYLKAAGYPTSQIASSLTNVLVTISIARHASALEFGALSVCLVFYSVVISISGNSIGTIPALRSDLRAGDGPTSALLGAAVISWSPVIAIALAVCLFIPSTIKSFWLIVAICLPLLMLHDLLRYVAFSQNRPWVAALLDIGWLTLLGSSFLAGLRNFDLLWAWGLSAGVVSAFFLLKKRCIPNLRRGVQFLRSEGKYMLKLALDGILNMLGSQLTLVFATGFIGLIGLGALRGAQTLLGPLAILHTALNVALTPRVADRLQTGLVPASRFASVIGGFATIFALALVFLSSTFPDSLGTILLGDTWNNSQEILTLLLFGMAGHLAALPAQTLLRASERSGTTMITARLYGTLLLVGLTLAGSAWFGVIGFAIGMAAARWLSAAIWIYMARKAATSGLIIGEIKEA